MEWNLDSLDFFFFFIVLCLAPEHQLPVVPDSV